MTRLGHTICVFVAALAAFLALGMTAFADKTAEYSRLTMGGGHSEEGRFVVDDSLTQSTGTAVQKGSRFEVVNVKSESTQSTRVTEWKAYE